MITKIVEPTHFSLNFGHELCFYLSLRYYDMIHTLCSN